MARNFPRVCPGTSWPQQCGHDPAIKTEGDMMQVIDVLAREVGVLGIFSDWPATTTFYANCAGLR